MWIDDFLGDLDRSSLKLQSLKKSDLISIMSDVIDPFYSKISEDSKLSHMISDDAFLFKLKIKQTKFTFKFLSKDLKDIQIDLKNIAMAHQRIDLKVDNFISYFFLWGSLILKWISKNYADENLQKWRGKILFIYSKLSTMHSRSDIQISKQRANFNFIDIEKLEDMHKNEKISAIEFLEYAKVDKYFLDELKDLESELGDELYINETLSEDAIASVTLLIFKYSKLLSTFEEFQELSYALNSLVNLLEQNVVDSENRKLSLLLSSIAEDLQNWSNLVFEKQEAKDIHYLDASLFSSCAQIDMILTDSDSDSELELF